MIRTLYPKFQEWTKTGSLFLTSDTHLFDFDRSLMGYDISEEEQIEILKKRCHKTDSLIHLGDVGDPSLFSELKCYKILIMGNHDETVTKFKEYFDEIYSGPLFISKKLVLSHEPISITTLNTPIAFNIHGHDHSNKINDKYHLNLAQNVFGYKPLNLSKFIKSGVLKNVLDIHRVTIDNANKKKGDL